MDRQALSNQISIVIFSHGSPGDCLRLLNSIETTGLDENRLDVILVYGGFNEKVEAVLNEHTFSFNLKLLPVEAGTNRAKGRNLGVKSSQHDIVLFLDTELEVSPELLIRHMDSYKNDDTIAVMGEQFLPPFVKKSRWFRFLDSDFRNIRRWAKEDHNATLPLRYVNTANFSVRKEAYIGCGGHDERIDNREAENIDLAHRLSAHNKGKIVYNPEAVAYSQHATLKLALRERYEFGREGIPKLLEIYPEIYGKLPSRFVRMAGYEPVNLTYRLLMAVLLTRPFLFIARGVRLLGPERVAYWMMRYMLQYYSVWGLRHALAGKASSPAGPE